MTPPSSKGSLLRERDGHGHGRVTNIELFFDLVFVFAVTQLSHTLHDELTVPGALHVLVLFLAVWWVWVYTAWVTNWLDPERPLVRLMLLVLMLVGLVLSMSLPQAFADKGLWFAGAYVTMQLGRTLFFLWAVRGHAPLVRNFQRITVWLLGSALLWIGGGLAQGDVRLLLWLLALGVDMLGPSLYFRVPGLGRSTTAEWDVEGGHLAERCSLFIIIALGESVLVTGATFAGLPWDSANTAAFASAFLGSVAMWWIYFNIGAGRGSRQIAGSADPGRVARAVYTYFHIPIIAGIVVSAVADEISIAHPDGHMQPAFAACLLGGPALYLLGNVFFKRASAKYYPLSHLAGLGLLVLLAPLAPYCTPLALGAATTAVLIVVAGWETLSFARA
jgi:low temperature requirement protein LtrA